MKKNKLIFGIISLALLILAIFCPPILGMSAEGARCLIVFIVFLILSLTNILPSGMASILCTCFMGVIGGFTGMGAAFKSVSVSLMAFCMGTLAITVALKRTSIPHRVAAFAAKISGGNSKVIILFFMFAACLLSAIMSNVAACATLASMAYGICKTQEETANGVKNFGKCMMVGIPVAAGIGGCGTIAGSVNNVTALEMLTSYNGSTIDFGPWAILMIPATLVAMVLVWLILITIWKPEKLGEEVVASTHQKSADKMTAIDKKSAFVITLMVVLWISTTWVKIYNTNFISLLGVALFILSGCFSWDEFSKEIRWDSVLLCGGVMGVVQGLINTGVDAWLGDVLFGHVTSLSPIILGMLITVAGFILHAFIPVGGPIASILTLPAISLCEKVGLNPAIAVMLVLVGANTCTLLPIDHLPILTQTYGYYKPADYTKAGIPVTIALTILLPLIVIPLANVVGL